MVLQYRFDPQYLCAGPGGIRLSSTYPASRSLHHYLAFRVLVEAAHPDIADAVIVHLICQEELYNP